MASRIGSGRSVTRVNRRGLAVFAFLAILFAGVLIAGAASAKKHGNSPHSDSTNAPTLAASRSPSPSAARLPSFAYPGDQRCAITYRARGTTSMTWTAIIAVAGQLITHASDESGTIYRHVARVTPGAEVFTAPVPLSQVNDIGGVLSTAGSSYACSVAPYRPGHRIPHKPRPKASHRPRPQVRPSTPPAAPVTQPPTAASCYPLSDEGTCYEPGEYCRYSDEGTTGVAGDGEQIVCEDNDGWRWEPA
jgi:hypothetical protein